MLGIHVLDVLLEIIGLCSAVYHLAHWYFHKKYGKKSRKRRLPVTKLK